MTGTIFRCGRSCDIDEETITGSDFAGFSKLGSSCGALTSIELN